MNENVKEFWCKDLTPYVDSMLFDSGEQIANMVYQDDEWKINVSLEIRGEVRVEYKGDTYRYPSDFPTELIERIKSNPNWWNVTDSNSDVYIDNNNWFEYIYDVIDSPSGKKYSDGHLCEWDISNGNSRDIMDDMLEIVNWIKGE